MRITIVNFVSDCGFLFTQIRETTISSVEMTINGNGGK